MGLTRAEGRLRYTLAGRPPGAMPPVNPRPSGDVPISLWRALLKPADANRLLALVGRHRGRDGNGQSSVRSPANRAWIAPGGIGSVTEKLALPVVLPWAIIMTGSHFGLADESRCQVLQQKNLTTVPRRIRFHARKVSLFDTFCKRIGTHQTRVSGRGWAGAKARQVP